MLSVGVLEHRVYGIPYLQHVCSEHQHVGRCDCTRCMAFLTCSLCAVNTSMWAGVAAQCTAFLTCSLCAVDTEPACGQVLLHSVRHSLPAACVQWTPSQHVGRCCCTVYGIPYLQHVCSGHRASMWAGVAAQGQAVCDISEACFSFLQTRMAWLFTVGKISFIFVCFLVLSKEGATNTFQVFFMNNIFLK